LRRPITPGDQVVLEVVGDRIKSRSAVVTGTARVGGEPAAEARIRFAIVPPHRAAAALTRRGPCPDRAIGARPPLGYLFRSDTIGLPIRRPPGKTGEIATSGPTPCDRSRRRSDRG